MAYHADIILDQNGKTKCGLCKVLIQDSDVFIEEHLNDRGHAEMFRQRLMVQNNFEVNGDRITCGICKRDASLSELTHHIGGPHHRDILASIKKIIQKDGGLLVLPENVSNIGSDVHCLVCDRCVDFNLDSVRSHIESARHRRARAIAIQPHNAIFSVEGSDEDLWCKICQVYFQNYIEILFEHVDDDPKHNTRLKKILLLIQDQNISIEKFLFDPKEDKAFCKKCGIEVPCNVDNLERHIKGKKHTT